MERHYWIDMVKGLTIILVVFHHGFMGVSNAGLVSDTLMNLYSLTKPIRMPLFFMVAGFFAARSLRYSFKQFFNAKLLHFLYFFILWNSIATFTRASLSNFTNNEVYYFDALKLFWDPTFTLWFLYALFLSFFFSWFFYRINSKLIITFVCVACIAYEIYNPKVFTYVFESTIMLFPFFVVGVFFSKKIISFITLKTNWIVMLGALSLSMLCFIVQYNTTDNYIVRLLYYPFALLYSFTIMCLMRCLEETLIRKPFIFIGQRSLYIYLMHFLPVAGANFLFIKVLSLKNSLFIAGFSSAVAVISCVVAYYLLKKSNLTRWLIERPRQFKLS